MSTLLDFLAEHPVDNITAEIKISERLKDFKATIRPMSGPEFAAYSKLATKISKGQKVEFNSQTFNEKVVINHTIDPSFKDAKFLSNLGVTTPEQALYKVLLAGEISELASQISQLSGFDKDIEDDVEEAKNS